MSDEPAGQEQDRLRAAIEATRLRYGLTSEDVIDLVQRTLQLGARGVCVPPAFVPLVARELSFGLVAPFDLVTVANFPLGDLPVRIVQEEARAAVLAGADHLDLVVPGALIAERDWRGLVVAVRAVRETIDRAANRPIALKAILETAAWDLDRVSGAAAAAVEGGANWLKTSTGFHPAGGATPSIVHALRRIAPDTVGIKASGGIRTRADALAMLDAGADRIGTSAEDAVLDPRK